MNCSTEFWIFGSPVFTHCPKCDTPRLLQFPERDLRPLAEYERPIDLQTIEVETKILRLIPHEIAVTVPALPVAVEGQVLTVVVPLESEPESFDEICFRLNRDIRGLLTHEADIRAAIARNYPVN
ncbi:MAG: hypothetical protein AB8G99_05350 [Planctomycetaceae bacterium]